jgi:hypothetical protein
MAALAVDRVDYLHPELVQPYVRGDEKWTYIASVAPALSPPKR